MVFGKNVSKVASINLEEVESKLSAKDGNVHVLFVNGLVGSPRSLGVNDKLTIPVENVVSLMQSRGYEIVDIKFETDFTDNLAGYFNVLIIYR